MALCRTIYYADRKTSATEAKTENRKPKFCFVGKLDIVRRMSLAMSADTAKGRHNNWVYSWRVRTKKFDGRKCHMRAANFLTS